MLETARTCSSRSVLPRASSIFSSSYEVSKWSSIAFLPRPVTMMILVRPAATASSMTYWMIGLSTRGSISFGWALVAGRNRVPRPAAGNTALRIFIEPSDASTAVSEAGGSGGTVVPPARIASADSLRASGGSGGTVVVPPARIASAASLRAGERSRVLSCALPEGAAVLDLRFVVENRDRVVEMLGRRGLSVDGILAAGEPWALDAERRSVLQKVEQLRHRQRLAGEEIARRGKAREDASGLKAEMKGVAEEIKELEALLQDVQARLDHVLLLLPNVPDPSVPVGGDASANQEV